MTKAETDQLGRMDKKVDELIRISAKLEVAFENVSASITKLTDCHSANSTRIDKLESERDQVVGGGKVALWVYRIVGVTAIAWLGKLSTDIYNCGQQVHDIMRQLNMK